MSSPCLGAYNEQTSEGMIRTPKFPEAQSLTSTTKGTTLSPGIQKAEAEAAAAAAARKEALQL